MLLLSLSYPLHPCKSTVEAVITGIFRRTFSWKLADPDPGHQSKRQRQNKHQGKLSGKHGNYPFSEACLGLYMVTHAWSIVLLLWPLTRFDNVCLGRSYKESTSGERIDCQLTAQSPHLLPSSVNLPQHHSALPPIPCSTPTLCATFARTQDATRREHSRAHSLSTPTHLLRSLLLTSSLGSRHQLPPRFPHPPQGSRLSSVLIPLSRRKAPSSLKECLPLLRRVASTTSSSNNSLILPRLSMIPMQQRGRPHRLMTTC